MTIIVSLSILAWIFYAVFLFQLLYCLITSDLEYHNAKKREFSVEALAVAMVVRDTPSLEGYLELASYKSKDEQELTTRWNKAFLIWNENGMSEVCEETYWGNMYNDWDDDEKQCE